MEHRESFRLRCSRVDVSAFADRFEAFCELHAVGTKVVRAFQIALDDVLTNIVDYAHDDGGEHAIAVHVHMDDDALVAEVVDDGKAFDPLTEREGPDLSLEVEDRPIGGLGIHLLRTLMDDVRYRRDHEGNHLILCKRLQSGSRSERHA